MGNRQRATLLGAALCVLLMQNAVQAASAHDAIDPLDARMEAEIKRLRVEQAHLETQMRLADQIQRMQFRINQLRQHLLQELQEENVATAPNAVPAPAPSNQVSPSLYPSPDAAEQVVPSPRARPMADTLAMAVPAPRKESPLPPPPPATSSSFAAVSPAQKSTTPTLAQERAQVVKRIADIQAQISPWAGASLEDRSRTGIAGISKLSEINGTLAASTTVGDAGRLTASVSEVHLSSGGQPAPAEAQLVGTAPLHKGSVPVVTDKAIGTAFELAFTRPNWQVHVGTTPSGFLVHGITGGIFWRPAGSPLDVQVKRSPVRDSMLSYAGLYDPYTGSNWGGVFANTLQISAGNGHDPVRYGSASYSLLQGTHVAENQSWSVDAGLRWPIATDDPDQKLQVGGNLLVMGYQRNLSFFTYGQGGYFSPSAFYRPSLTVDWDGRMGDHTAWHLGGQIGYQSFRQESSPYFPNDPLFEAESGQQYYPAQNVSGIAYAMDGDISYLLTKRWMGGGWFDVGNSHNYQNIVVGLDLQYFFNPQIAPHAADRIGQSLGEPQY